MFTQKCGRPLGNGKTCDFVAEGRTYGEMCDMMVLHNTRDHKFIYIGAV